MTVSIDANILVYSVDARDPLKAEIAQAVILAARRRGGQLALQVIGEFQYAAVRRLKLPPDLAAAAAREFLRTFETFSYDKAAVESALNIAGTRLLSYWDALLLSSVEAIGVSALITEDMQDGGRHGSVELVNPFSPGGISPRARAVLEL